MSILDVIDVLGLCLSCTIAIVSIIMYFVKKDKNIKKKSIIAFYVSIAIFGFFWGIYPWLMSTFVSREEVFSCILTLGV